MKRALQGGVGVLLVLVGITAITLGGLLLASFGRDGTLGVESRPLQGTGAALVTEDLEVGGGGSLQQRLGTLTFGARSPDGAPLFIGLASADDVFGYLDGVPYEVVSGIGGEGTTQRPVPGTASPAPPQEESFWQASAMSTAPEFTWPSDGGGDQRLVVMNANGSRAVAATLRLTFHSTTVFPLAVTGLVSGAVALLLGVLLLLLSVRAARRQPAAAGPGPALADPPPPGPAVEPTAPDAGTTVSGAPGAPPATTADG